DVPQRPGRPGGGLRPRWPELPDRAPPVPEHGPAEPQARAGDRPGLLRPARNFLRRVRLGPLVRVRAAAPPHGRRTPSDGEGDTVTAAPAPSAPEVPRNGTQCPSCPHPLG